MKCFNFLQLHQLLRQLGVEETAGILGLAKSRSGTPLNYEDYDLMKTMAMNHQIISISHLPQIAAKGDAHYVVYKNNNTAKTTSSIKRLSEAERIEEIAKMIGGSKPSKIALENAQELLAK